VLNPLPRVGSACDPCVCVCVVNNAGVGLVGPVDGLSTEDMANIFETNFYGAVRMIKGLVHPKMKIKSLITHPHPVPIRPSIIFGTVGGGKTPKR